MTAGCIALCLLLLSHAQPGSFLVGNWYGEEQPNDPNVLWLARFWPDGRFEAEFRTCRKTQSIDEIDKGSWTYRDGAAEVTSTLVNGRPIHVVDRYKTLSYSGNKHVYRHERTGYVFTAVRVDADFELPSCSLSG